MACAGPTFEGFETAGITVSTDDLTVAVADTGEQRSQGLQGRDALPAGIDGMLFVYEDARTAEYHMRTVGFPLDLWWFDEDGQLLGSTQMVPCPDGECVGYPSPGPIMWALETPAGEWEFTRGSRLRLP